MKSLRWTLGLLVLFLSALSGSVAFGQAYTQIVIIGDSLTDTGNDTAASTAANTALAAIPAPVSGYTYGRFTDGTDTSPAAVNYTGVWAEQLAKMLPAQPQILNSLGGGTNYAYGFAFTGSGTSAFNYGTNNVLTFNVQNMGLQLSTYLATNPTITNKTLFIVWGGANDLLNATTPAAIVAAATNEVGIVQQLIAAGATNILVPNLPPLGLVPRVNGIPATAAAATQAAAGFDQALAAGLAQVIAAAPSVHIYQLDTYTLFNTIVGPPIAQGLANVTAMSQGNTTVNPDTFLFWDSLHPTTYGHRLLANAAFTLLNGPVGTTTGVTSSTSNSNLTASVTLTAKVTATTGSATPVGTVTFSDGSNVLGSSVITGSTTVATATYTTSALTAGAHNITAAFAGVNGFSNSTSSVFIQTVTAPAVTASFNPTIVTIFSGATGTSTLYINPVGGFSGTALVACGTLPTPHFSCTPSASSLTLKGDNTQQIVAFSFNTQAAALHLPPPPGTSNTPQIFSAFTFLSLLGFVGLRRRKSFQKLTLLVLLLASGAAITLGLSGCSNSNSANSNLAATGTYNVPVSFTINGTSYPQKLTVIIQ